MRIFDCFMFYNELDVLEIRLSTLYPVVDYFVLAEATETHSGLVSKTLVFDDNRERFEPFLDKIIHVKIDESLGVGPRQRTAFHRECISRGLTDCRPDDAVCISDVDEIPRPELLEKVRCGEMELPKVFNLDRRSYCLNLSTGGETDCFVVMLWEDLSKHSPEWARVQGRNLPQVPNAGWHFTFVGDNDFIRNKLRTWMHLNLNAEIDRNLDARRGRLIDPIGRGPVSVCEDLPSVVSDDRARYQHLLYE